MIFISHDLGAVAKISDDILVMKNGKIVEKGETRNVLRNPENEHTRYLINTRKALMDKFTSCRIGGDLMLLEVKNVYKSYKKPSGIIKKEKIEVLKGVSLSLDQGKCLGVIGV